MNEVNHIDVGNYDDDYEVNEAHVRNPNYKGKNYDPNFQNRNKTNNTSSNNVKILDLGTTRCTAAMESLEELTARVTSKTSPPTSKLCSRDL